MKVQLDKAFAIDASTEAAWELLSDIPAVAQCMPGAEITEQLDDSQYKGKVKFKIGPVATSFRGQITVHELLPMEHTVTMEGRGGDSKGSSATMNLRAHIADTDDGVSLVGNAEISMTGKLVSFGARVINPVADQILEQFGANFTAKLAERNAQAASNTANSISAEEPQENTAAESSAVANENNSETNALNPIALVWSALLAWLRGLFSRNQ